MQTIGHSDNRAGTAPASSLLEKASWLDKLPLTIVSGVLLGFSSAGYGIWWLAWVALAPLLLLTQGSRNRGEALFTGLVFGLSYHLVSLRWFLDLYPLDWLGIKGWFGYVVAGQFWILESLHEALLFAAFAMFIYSLPMRNGYMPHWKRPYFPMLISVPLIWLFLKWVIAPSPLFFGLPIDQLAYSQSKFPPMIQIARFGGAQMVELLLVLSNCVIAGLLLEMTNLARKLNGRSDKISDTLGAVMDVILVGALAYSAVTWGQAEVLRAAAAPRYWQQPGGKPGEAGSVKLTPEQKAQFAPAIPIAVAQPNFSMDEMQKFSGAQMAERVMPLIDNLGVGLIVLPSDILDSTRRSSEPLRHLLPALTRSQRKDVVVGLREGRDEAAYGGVRVLSTDTSIKAHDYVKYRLLPFVEYTPFALLRNLVPDVLRTKVTGGIPNVQSQFLHVPQSIWGRIGASVGAEVLYPDLIVSEVNRGASLLVNVCDLSYFHHSILGQELLAAGIMRAVENGRYLVVASNTGISAVVDPRGIVTTSSLSDQKGVLLDRVQFLHKKTPFTRFNLWTPLYH